MTAYLAVIILIALVFDFSNGFHDAANSIATVVSTRVLSPRAAVVWAAVFNFVAFLVYPSNVSSAIAKGVELTAVTNNVILATLVGAIAWNLVTWWSGLPSSSSHALMGAFARMGWDDVATQVQELYLQGKKQEAAAAIPLEMVEDVALVGPPDKIRDDLAEWKETCLTTVLLSGKANQLEMLADLING